MNPILKGKKIKTRILRPQEYELLKLGAKTSDRKTFLDSALLTGARYSELQRIQIHPELLEGKFITIPEERKEKRTAPERWIRLSNLGTAILPYLKNIPPLPTPQGFKWNLVKWAERGGLDPQGLSPRTFRKTWESWLMFYYPAQSLAIAQSQGHTLTTALQHYINLPFTDEDKAAIKPWVEGWI